MIGFEEEQELEFAAQRNWYTVATQNTGVVEFATEQGWTIYEQQEDRFDLKISDSELLLLISQMRLRDWPITISPY